MRIYSSKLGYGDKLIDVFLQDYYFIRQFTLVFVLIIEIYDDRVNRQWEAWPAMISFPALPKFWEPLSGARILVHRWVTMQMG
jgi:hypothetical protein